MIMKNTIPTLLLDKKKCIQNIQKIFNKTKRNQVKFRPHFKTHQSIEVGNWFKEYGVNAITVSSVKMAKYFSNDWKDILVAFPVNILEIKEINELAEKLKLTLLIENIEALSYLASNLTSPVYYYIKIDIGYHRTGINPKDENIIEQLMRFKSDKLNFIGFLGHAGHSYKCRSEKEILEIHTESITVLKNLKSKYISEFPNLLLSTGDTPTCSIAEDFSGIDEIRPGNFVFYDLTQNNIGSNSQAEIAVCMECPVVAIHNERNEVIIYGGGVHFAKDFLIHKEYGTIYGLVVNNTDWSQSIEGCYIKSLSQEHGILQVSDEFLHSLTIGDTVHILPVHSCMTANSMKEYVTLDGDVISRL